MDTRTPEQRSRIMRSVKGRNTGPEVSVRRLLHAMGFRFRIHRKELPGTPDIVLPMHRSAIFVHGCFWHGHECRKGLLPKSRLKFWSSKIERNRARDADCAQELEADGWRVLIVWQCQTKDAASLAERLESFLKSTDFEGRPMPFGRESTKRRGGRRFCGMV